jgi:two-component system sensor histidine kinase SenX3
MGVPRVDGIANAGAVELDGAAVLAALPVPWIVLDRDTVTHVNAAAVALGLVRDGSLRHAALSRAARAARRSGQVVDIPLDGSPRTPLPEHLSARCAPLAQERVLVLVSDRSEAQRVDDVRRDFVANVSHELKTPVGALALLAEAVADAADDSDAVQRFAERMQTEARRLAQLVNELIDLSRLQGDDALAHARPVVARDVIADAVDQCRLSAAARDIEILSTGQTDIRLFGDREQLIMAVRNLVDNAIKYSPAKTRVTVSVGRSGDQAEVSVTDQGIGIPAKDTQRIFERFYRVDPARSRETGGTGLGLAIVKHVAANHGGDVRVWSVEGAGSTFTVRLPTADPIGAGQTESTQPGGGVGS